MPFLPAAASVFSDITESMFLAKDGQFRLDSAGSPATLNSALFKLCYHRYGTLRTSVSWFWASIGMRCSQSFRKVCHHNLFRAVNSLSNLSASTLRVVP